MSSEHIQAGSNLHWNTPEVILDYVREFYGSVDLDPCSNEFSTVQAKHTFMLPYRNGLVGDWDVSGLLTNAFVNPPFGKCYLRNDLDQVMSAKEWTNAKKNPNFDESLYTGSSIKDWIRKGIEQHNHCAVNSLFLIPAAVDTATWQNYIFPDFHAVCFIKGRVSFMDRGVKGGPSPMATALAYIGTFQDDMYLFEKVFSNLGKVILL